MSKQVVVTGANRGIGLSLVQTFLKNGWQVYATCRDPEKAESLQAIKDENLKGIFAMSLGSAESADAAMAQIKSSLGDTKLDLLINNAGIASPNHPRDPVLEATKELMMPVLETNVMGNLQVTQAALRHMSVANVLFISSFQASITKALSADASTGNRDGGMCIYAVSKAALNMVMMQFAIAPSCKGTNFVTASPGWVDTDMGSAGGRAPPLSPEKCAEHLFAIGSTIDSSKNGCFLNYDGSVLPF